MKKFIYLTLFFVTLSATAQEVLIPFKKGNLFGLSNKSGKIKLKPAYQELHYLGNNYFQAVDYKKETDSVKIQNKNFNLFDKPKRITNLLNGIKVIISNSEHNHFFVVENALIVGSEDTYSSKNSNFYTLKGEQLLNKNAQKFRIMDQYGNFERPKTISNFLTLYVEHYDRSISILVFDKKKQQIVEKLIDQADSVTFDRQASDETYLSFSYVDKNGDYQNKQLYIDKEEYRYIIRNTPPRPYQENKYSNESGGKSYGSGNGNSDQRSEKVEMVTLGTGDEMNVVVPPSMSQNQVSVNTLNSKVYHYLTWINDSVINYGEKVIKLSTDEKVIFTEHRTRIKMQKHSLIYSLNGKKGLLISDEERIIPEYDSLQYIKNEKGIYTERNDYVYLAGKKNPENGKWKMGIIDGNGKIIIPLVYDRLLTYIPQLNYDKDSKTNKFSFYTKNKDNHLNDPTQILSINRTGLLLAEKEGKQGILEISNKIILPVEYDFITENGILFQKKTEIQNEFYIFKQNDKYGIIKMNYKKEITLQTEAVFPEMPTHYYVNYGGIEGFNLFCLSNEESLRFCYATQNGKVFYTP